MPAYHALRAAASFAATLCLIAVAAPALAADPATKPASKAAPKPARKASAPAVVFIVPDATPDQVKAAELVYYGTYDCEFKQTIRIVQSPQHSAYVDLTHGKVSWLMKPVLSSTGAIRLEDVRGETLMVQIAAKSMLLNVKTAQRLVDGLHQPTPARAHRSGEGGQGGRAGGGEVGGRSRLGALIGRAAAAASVAPRLRGSWNSLCRGRPLIGQHGCLADL